MKTMLPLIALITGGALLSTGCKTDKPTAALPDPEASAASATKAAAEPDTKDTLKRIPIDRVKAAGKVFDAQGQKGPPTHGVAPKLTQIKKPGEQDAVQALNTRLLFTPPKGTPKNNPDIHKTFEAHRMDIRRCYEPELARDKHLKGIVIFDIDIAADGRATGAKVVHTTIKRDFVEDCLVKRIKGWTFPASGAQVTVRHTLPLLPPWLKPKDIRNVMRKPLKINPRDLLIRKPTAVTPKKVTPTPAQP